MKRKIFNHLHNLFIVYVGKDPKAATSENNTLFNKFIKFRGESISDALYT